MPARLATTAATSPVRCVDDDDGKTRSKLDPINRVQSDAIIAFTRSATNDRGYLAKSGSLMRKKLCSIVTLGLSFTSIMAVETAVHPAAAATLACGSFPLPPCAPPPTPDPQSSTFSIQDLADQRTNQMVTNRILSSVLLGVNEQVNCSDCVSGFGSAGSFSAGAHGRKAISDNVSLLGGIAYSQYGHGGYSVNAPLIAVAVRYDFTEWGSSRPFFDLGTVLSPSQRVSYLRSYNSSIGTSQIATTTHSSDYSVFERAGWVVRISPRDEFALAAELWQGWQHVDGYQEMTGPANPFDANIAGGTDRMNLAKIGGQWTHLFGTQIEANINGGFVQSFANSSGISAAITGVGTVVPTMGNQHWAELGARVGFRFTKNLVGDVFVNGTVGPAPVGNSIHGGVGLRLNF